MKKSILIAILATLSFSTPLTWAEEGHDPYQVNKPATTMTDKDKQMQMGKMQEKMLRMHEQMHKIMQSKDAKEREKLMQEHAQMMQDHMSMMQGMKGM
tara:strand:+ start:2874 stop:3167 length:294 start_codon:yes stop_codon:yes gene_type:complete